MMGLALSGLETALNAYLRLDPDTLTRLSTLKGKVVKVEITDWLINFYLLPQSDGLQLLNEYSDQPDTIIRGTLFGLLRTGQSKATSQSLFDNAIEIGGNIDLGSKIREILQGIDIDWEEYLSRVVGDGVAHKAMFHLKRTLDFGRHSFTTLTENLKDYLHEESRAFPSQDQVEKFYKEISTLRDAVDRAEARIIRLKTKN